MAPPETTQETMESYRRHIYERFKRDPEARQCMIIAARHFDPDPSRSPITFYGRYCDWARELICTLQRRIKEDAEEKAA
jgi:NurA-like 5'-3' nuclease